MVLTVSWTSIVWHSATGLPLSRLSSTANSCRSRSISLAKSISTRLRSAGAGCANGRPRRLPAPCGPRSRHPPCRRRRPGQLTACGWIGGRERLARDCRPGDAVDEGIAADRHGLGDGLVLVRRSAGRSCFSSRRDLRDRALEVRHDRLQAALLVVVQGPSGGRTSPTLMPSSSQPNLMHWTNLPPSRAAMRGSRAFMMARPLSKSFSTTQAS